MPMRDFEHTLQLLYPLVVKPAGRPSSIRVVVLRGEKEVADVISFLRQTSRRQSCSKNTSKATRSRSACTAMASEPIGMMQIAPVTRRPFIYSLELKRDYHQTMMFTRRRACRKRRSMPWKSAHGVSVLGAAMWHALFSSDNVPYFLEVNPFRAESGDSDLCSRVGWSYERLVAQFSKRPSAEPRPAG